MTATCLKAGAGKGIIRFSEEMFPIEGFAGIHDNPSARVLLLEQNEKISIVALELVNCPPKGIDLCKKIVEEKTGTKQENIWVHVTHAISTPHEPAPKGSTPGHCPEPTPEEQKKMRLFYDAIEAAVTEAARDAAVSFTEAVLGWGTGICDVNTNRDIETPYGWWVGLNGAGPSNKTMTILRVNTKEGTPIGFLISYGIKPCAIDISGMEEGTRKVSADVPGVACRMMEEAFGAPALFCMSAAGDQVPKEQAFVDRVSENGSVINEDFGVENGLKIVERLGKQMGKAAVAIAEKVICREEAVEIVHKTLNFFWQRKKRTQLRPVRVPEYIPEGEAEITAEIFKVGNAAFVAEKPEVNCITELQLKNQSPFEHTILISMINGGMKYMPDQWSYDHAAWEAQSAILMPGAAEKFVEAVTDMLKTLK